MLLGLQKVTVMLGLASITGFVKRVWTLSGDLSGQCLDTSLDTVWTLTYFPHGTYESPINFQLTSK